MARRCLMFSSTCGPYVRSRFDKILIRGVFRYHKNRKFTPTMSQLQLVTLFSSLKVYFVRLKNLDYFEHRLDNSIINIIIIKSMIVSCTLFKCSPRYYSIVYRTVKLVMHLGIDCTLLVKCLNSSCAQPICLVSENFMQLLSCTIILNVVQKLSVQWVHNSNLECILQKDFYKQSPITMNLFIIGSVLV